MIKLTLRGAVAAVREGHDPSVGYRQAFTRQHCVRLARVLDPAVTAYALRKAADERQGFYVQTKPDKPSSEEDVFVRELRAPGGHPVNILFHILLHQRAFLQAVNAICGYAGKLSRVTGRYYEMHAAHRHLHGWHDDCNGDRLFGFSINLSPRPPGGGQFQLRDAITKQLYAALDSQLGDCHFFRVHRQLEHRVVPVTGAEPRCAFAGWLLGEDANAAWQADLPAA